MIYMCISRPKTQPLIYSGDEYHLQLLKLSGLGFYSTMTLDMREQRSEALATSTPHTFPWHSITLETPLTILAVTLGGNSWEGTPPSPPAAQATYMTASNLPGAPAAYLSKGTIFTSSGNTDSSSGRMYFDYASVCRT